MLTTLVHGFQIDEAVALFALYQTNFVGLEYAVDYIFELESLDLRNEDFESKRVREKKSMKHPFVGYSPAMTGAGD